MEYDVKKLILGVLEKGYLMSLGTIDDSGVWVCDVIYIYDKDLNIFWMSKDFSRHSKAIMLNPKVAGTITISGPKENNLGIQFSGIAEKIKVARFDLAKQHYAKRKKPEPKEIDDVLDGGAWYTVKPEKIELIHEKLFGFEKQKLEF